MGLRLVEEAFSFGARNRLSHGEFRLLAHMAYTARDTDSPPLYFGSRETSAWALGRMVPDAPLPTDPDLAAKEAVRTAAFEAVKVAVRGLVKSGAIARHRRGTPGQRAVYELAFRELLLR